MCWIAENHNGGGGYIEQEAIKHQNVGNPSARVAEFAGCRNLYRNGLDRQRGYICAAKLPGCGGLSFLHLLGEKFAAAFVKHI